MVLTALAGVGGGRFDRGKRGGRLDPSKGAWLKTYIQLPGLPPHVLLWV